MTTRRRWFGGGLLAYLAIFAAVAGALFWFYQASRTRLEAALGERLLAVATTSALLIEDGDAVQTWGFDTEETTEFLWLSFRLEEIRRRNGLAEVTLCDPFGQVLISASGRLARGEENVFWQLDQGSVQQAVAGFPSVSHLYRRERLYQKSAHAPVFTSEGDVAGVLTVEGNADFFDSLATLRSGALATLAAVLLFLTLVGFFLWQVSRSLERYRASMLRQESLAAMGRMTAGIAHEIRNPLGIIKGAGEHLQRKLAAAGVDDEVAGYITDEVDRLDRILTGYLTFGSDRESEFESVDLVQLIRRSTQLITAELAAAGVDVVVTEPLPAAVVNGDPRRLQQVILNLLLNARDAMPAGGSVILALESRAQRHVLTMTDEGGGLGGVDPAQLFEPFWTSKEKGSGLGLALSRRIVVAHDGSLELSDRTDARGAVVTIQLPALQG